LDLLCNLGNIAVPKITPASAEQVIKTSSIRYFPPLFYQFK